MSALRTLLSALSILAGAVLIAAWAVSSVIVTAVEDGTALRGVTERAMDSAVVREALAQGITDQALAALSAQGIDVDRSAVRGAIESGVESAVSTPMFRDAVVAAVDDAHDEFADQLTDSLCEPAPLVLDVDVSDAVNERMDQAGGVGSVVPDVTVPAVGVEVLGADTFETTRDAYQRIEWLQRWGLVVGIALLAAGILVSHRRRWFVAKVLLAIAAITGAFGGAIALLGPATITTFIPGGQEGPLATLWRDVVTEEAAPVVMERSLWVGGIALAGAVVALLLGAALGGRRR